MIQVPDHPVIRCMEATGYPYWGYENRADDFDDYDDEDSWRDDE